MTTMNGSEVPVRPTPVLRSEVATVPGLGEVSVRMLRLSERLAMGREVTGARTAGAGSDDMFAPRLLALTVLDPSTRQPIYDVEQWDIFGAEHPAEVSALLDVAMRLSGFAEDASKNG